MWHKVQQGWLQTTGGRQSCALASYPELYLSVVICKLRKWLKTMEANCKDNEGNLHSLGTFWFPKPSCFGNKMNLFDSYNVL